MPRCLFPIMSLPKLRGHLASFALPLRNRTIQTAAVLALVILLSWTLFSPAQNSSGMADAMVQTLENQVDRFFSVIADGQVDDAFEDLLADSPALRGSATMGELKQRTKELEQRFGRLRSYERISGTRIGQDVVVLKYLFKCENYPIVWYFTFYRTSQPGGVVVGTPTWTLIGVRFDTQVELLALTR